MFGDERAGEWVLKGGTGVLARVPDARSTLDIDLHSSSGSLQGALAELRRMAGRDLADHFRFLFLKREPISIGDAQPYLNGYRVTFTALIGAKAVEHLKVDLVVGPTPTGRIRSTTPANRLRLPRLITCDYRLYPVEDQIADKVCATLAHYRGRSSSREKDLVDLVVLTVTTTDLDMGTLRRALHAEFARRQQPVTPFAAPGHWGPAYAAAASRVPQCSPYPDVATAADLIASLLDPVLSSSDEGTWDPVARAWDGVSG